MNPNDMNKNQENQMAVFQYMIGNTDYSISALHNMKILKENDFHRPDAIAVPYDFDYSGLVNAPYAIPSDKYDLKTVRDRKFLGACHSRDIYLGTARHFIEKKGNIYNEIESFQYLEDDYRQQLLSYVQEFFDMIEAENGLGHFLISDCKTY